ncbi:prolyl oligopeptidase family serine peptidase [Flavivirga amylovorans]|uniref:Prolyl oligopeptidase family serine peptidase n=1 Tax=Flavivirga amylovorans TaxID=870486 RepID=A0ABT8WZZ2_9FLAO|nr:prolyl oligopeptidase family serine peptidase [Flavivirga amylovorans]MDO5987255.1 prolyl oligopeptidase family serine peptidase [Flavivirga amylovorans]
MRIWIFKLVVCFSLFSCNSNDNEIDNIKSIDNNKPFEYSFTKYQFNHELTKTTIPYHLFEPEQSINTDEKFPLIVALHGSEFFASKEEDFLFSEKFGYYALAWIKESNQKKYPAYVLAPHIHENLWKENLYDTWGALNSIDFIDKLTDYIISNKNIDIDRIYLTGHSMGGAGTWIIGAKLKDKFAALVPLSSALTTGNNLFKELKEKVDKGIFKDLPVWSFIHKKDADNGDRSHSGHGCRVLFEIFKNKNYKPVITHGFREEVTNLSKEEIEQKISKCYIHFYTEYNYADCTGICHYSMTRALKEPLLFKWLFQQKK